MTLGFDEHMGIETSMGGTQANENVSTLEVQDGQLLPGLLDEIILNLVVPRLPWKSVPILASVNRSWRQAAKSRQIYDSRVLFRSTETFLVTLVLSSRQPPRYDEQIGLYSMNDRIGYTLPHLPESQREGPGFPLFCRCILLGGQVYVLGGEKETFRGSSEVYVFDLRAQSGWQKCADMHEARYDFGCAVKDGKIYVFGGTLRTSPSCGSECYDPETNVWSRISPMPSRRGGHQVIILGEELIVYGGQVYYRDYAALDESTNEDMFPDEYVESANFLEVYHPVKDEWRVVQPIGKQFEGVVFTAGGKLHSLTNHVIEVYDSSKNAWSRRHSSALGPGNKVYPQGVLVCNDELLVGILLESDIMQYPGSYLLQSTGFDSDMEAIVWQREKLPLSFGGNGMSVYPLLGFVQL
ncbi:unnamed protein product [Calypogeia fissa]